MNGWDIVHRVHARLARLGFSKLPAPDKILMLIGDQMQELNGRVALHVAADVSFSTTVNQRSYRLRDAGVYMNPLKILRASYNGNPLLVEKAWQFTGEVDAGTTPSVGSPAHIWLVTETYGPSGTLPVSQKSVWVYPMPDAVYTIHCVMKMPVPAYTNLYAELPVRFESHEAVLACVMRELFMAKDFHDNAQKAMWEQKAREAEALLSLWEERYVVEHQPMLSEETITQVE